MHAPNSFKPLTKDDLAELLGVSARTIENWVNEGVVPAPKKLGGRVYWHPRMFFDWLDRRLQSDGDDDRTAVSRVPGEGEAEVASVPPQQAKPPRQTKRRFTDASTIRARGQAELDRLLA